MTLDQFKKLNIPDNPGVYSFIKDGQVLYIGKATSLCERLRSYFSPDLINTRGRRISNMVAIADKIEFENADSVLEAFIRETELIKKYQPITNSLSKDNKSFNYVVITDEDFPRVQVERGRNIEKNAVDFKDLKTKYIFGPYPYGSELREAMKILRRIFPYRDSCIPAEELKSSLKPRPCFNKSIGLCPGVCTGEISRKDYLKIINNIRLFFEGKKSKVIANLKKEMMLHAKKQEFELAEIVKKTLFSAEHIKDISMIKRDADKGSSLGFIKNKKEILNISASDWQGEEARKQIRIESYDIAHMSGKDMVGVMCVMTDEELNKSQYRKFIVNDYNSSNDTGALKEVLIRRFNHSEWPSPDIIVVDGGISQINAVQSVINNRIQSENTPIVVSVVKDEKHKAKDILFSDNMNSEKLFKLISKDKIIELNADTHRFAITFHKKKRGENFLPKTKNK